MYLIRAHKEGLRDLKSLVIRCSSKVGTAQKPSVLAKKFPKGVGGSKNLSLFKRNRLPSSFYMHAKLGKNV